MKLDLTGKKLSGKGMVIEATEKRKCGNVIWKCICDCGKEFEAQSNNLKNGRTRSCGCLQKQMRKKWGNKQIKYRWSKM